MSRESNGWMLGAVVLAVILNARATPLHAQSVEEKTQVCAGCHGADGKPIPTIWGQQAGYIYIELRDFKRGDRKSDIMQPIASAMERPDMLDIAQYLSGKPDETWRLSFVSFAACSRITFHKGVDDLD
jgi:cytochrome c553